MMQHSTQTVTHDGITATLTATIKKEQVCGMTIYHASTLINFTKGDDVFSIHFGDHDMAGISKNGKFLLSSAAVKCIPTILRDFFSLDTLRSVRDAAKAKASDMTKAYKASPQSKMQNEINRLWAIATDEREQDKDYSYTLSCKQKAIALQKEFDALYPVEAAQNEITNLEDEIQNDERKASDASTFSADGHYNDEQMAANAQAYKDAAEAKRQKIAALKLEHGLS